MQCCVYCSFQKDVTGQRAADYFYPLNTGLSLRAIHLRALDERREVRHAGARLNGLEPNCCTVCPVEPQYVLLPPAGSKSKMPKQKNNALLNVPGSKRSRATRFIPDCCPGCPSQFSMQLNPRTPFGDADDEEVPIGQAQELASKAVPDPLISAGFISEHKKYLEETVDTANS